MIKRRIMIAVGGCSLAALLLLGSISLSISSNILRTYAYSESELLAENYAHTLDQMITQIETSVNDLSFVLMAMLDDPKRFQQDAEYVKSYQESVRPVVKEIAERTQGAMTCYVRFNPEFTDPVSGLFHADMQGDGDIEALVPTDFSQYEPSDLAHVGWYYLPIEAGKAIWLDRYYNENIGVDMVSYVVPLFKDGVTIGVVGMDISFDEFTSVVESIQPYEHSFAMLVNANHQFLIHPTYDLSSTLADVNPKVEQEVNENKHGNITINGEQGEVLLSYVELNNGHHLLVQSLTSEIFANVQLLKRYIVLITVGVILVAFTIAYWIGARITKPITRLVNDMKRVQQGDLTVQTAITTKDETAVIGKHFNDMVGDLAKLTDQLNHISQQIERSSLSVKHSVGELVQASEEAAASVEEIATGNHVQSNAIEQCSEIATSLSEKGKLLQVNTAIVTQYMHTINDNKDAGLKLVGDLVSHNSENQQAVVQIEAAVLELDAKAAHVQAMIQTIRDIADQTNLLALNASIESARAGEAGRGFAVVASEIRKLAEQSNRSATDIDSLLTHIQQYSTTAVDALQLVKQRRYEQDEAIGTVNEAFQTIAGNIQGIDEKLHDNASSINNLLEEAERLTGEIVEIVAIAEQSSAASDQVAYAMQSQTKDFEAIGYTIEGLNELVVSLNELMAQFKLEPNDAVSDGAKRV